MSLPIMPGSIRKAALVGVVVLGPLVRVSRAQSDSARADSLPDRQQQMGFWFPNLGTLSGSWEASVGLHFSGNHLYVRNSQLRINTNLWSGVRVVSVVRSNREFVNTAPFDPNFDELYMEGFGYHFTPAGRLSFSLKFGEMRYLRFPASDILSAFDQVPGVSDLNGASTLSGPTRSAYDGLLLVVDFRSRWGLGYHGDVMQWMFHDRRDLSSIENYAYYKTSVSAPLGSLRALNVEFEARAGRLQIRPEPLGRHATGVNAYAGVEYKAYRVGAIYEKLNGQDHYFGVLVTLSPSAFSRFVGAVHADYTRAPEGFAVQVPVLAGTVGYGRRAPDAAQLIGETTAERTITFWQNSQARNFSEHMIGSRGADNAEDNGTRLLIVIDEQPWYLKNEAVVGAALSARTWGDFADWNTTASRLGELGQPVTFRYYLVDAGTERKFSADVRLGFWPLTR